MEWLRIVLKVSIKLTVDSAGSSVHHWHANLRGSGRCERTEDRHQDIVEDVYVRGGDILDHPDHAPEDIRLCYSLHPLLPLAHLPVHTPLRAQPIVIPQSLHIPAAGMRFCRAAIPQPDFLVSLAI